MVKMEVISDLAKLLNKHGADTLRELAAYLKEPANVDDLVLILESTSKLGKQKSKKVYKERTSISQPLKILENLKGSDLEKFHFLNQMYQKLLVKELLPTLKDIKFFREDMGLNISKSKSRNQAIRSLIACLISY
jgi:hypothetical protein